MGRRFVMVPGIGGSGPEHWQSHWETLYPNTLRIEPNSWDEPDLADWFAALDRAVASAPYPPVLVWPFARVPALCPLACGVVPAIAAAFLVAVPDPSGPAFPAQAKAFGALPATGFGERPVLAVASENDPYDPTASAIAWAARQGAWPRRLGPRGHLNEASNLGAWPEGQGLLADFLDEIGE